MQFSQVRCLVILHVQLLLQFYKNYRTTADQHFTSIIHFLQIGFHNSTWAKVRIYIASISENVKARKWQKIQYKQECEMHTRSDIGKVIVKTNT